MRFRAFAVVAVAVVALLGGCATAWTSRALFPEPFERYAPPEVPIPPAAPGQCTSVARLAPGVSRDCESVSVPAGYLEALQEAAKMHREQTAPALVACQEGRDDDRVGAQDAFDACAEQLSVCEDQKPRQFAAGFGVGCATCGGGAGMACGAATR